MPFRENVLNHMEFLSSTQSLVDYAALVRTIKEALEAGVPMVVFGGSYGGMLAARFRLKHRDLMDGAIAASAPVLMPINDPDHQVVSTTDNVRHVGGGRREAKLCGECPDAMAAILCFGESADGHRVLAAELRVCNPEHLSDVHAAEALAATATDALGNLAMGNYPYPISYIASGVVNLSGYPMRAACVHLAPDFNGDEKQAIAGLRGAAGVLLNALGMTSR